MFLDLTLEGWDRSTKKFSEIVVLRDDSRVSESLLRSRVSRKTTRKREMELGTFSRRAQKTFLISGGCSRQAAAREQ
jgi:hypothetical protein